VVAAFLRERGFNVKTATETGLVGHSDENHLAAAHRNNRVLITHDSDFLDDRRFPEHRNPGLVVISGGSGSTGELVEAIRVVLELIAPFREVWRGYKIAIAADGHITMRGRSYSGRETTRYRMTRNGPALVWVDDELY